MALFLSPRLLRRSNKGGISTDLGLCNGDPGFSQRKTAPFVPTERTTERHSMQGIQHPEVVMREDNSYHVLRVTPRDCRTETCCRNQSAAILIRGDRNGEETGQ